MEYENMDSGSDKINKEHKVSEEQFHKIFDGIVLGFAICELILDKHGHPEDYRFLRVNPAFEKQTALKNASVVGKTVKEIYPDIEQSWIDKYGSVVLDKNPIHFIEYNHNTKRTYSVNTHSFSENKFVMFFEDITEQTKSKKALRASEREYKGLFNSMAEMFQVIELIYDKSGKAVDYYYLQVNPAFEKLVNKKKEQLVGKRAKEVFKIIEEHWLETYDRVEKTGIPVTYENYGAELDKHYSINAWKVDERKVAVIFTDITARKHAEKELLKNYRLKAIGEMASSVAHDFNNSLQSITGNLEIAKIEKDLSDATLDRLNNITGIITDIAERVKALQRFGDTVNDSKESELVDLNSILEESLIQSQPLWKDSIEKKGLKIHITTAFGDIPKINCNKGEMKSVIFNLIKNSIEAMPEGGEISIETSIKDKYVFLTFTDTGIGMDEETKLKLFQPFYTTKGFELGRGLGMSGVYGLIKKYGGDISVKFSEIGKGTVIEIVYPLSQQSGIESPNKEEVTTNKYYTILWVDDDLTIRENASELVELMGHKCDVANGGKNALKHLNQNKYDIVFTDIGMPEMNGWELSHTIRSKFGNKIKIVVVSGWDIDENTKTKNGVNFVLQKPFTLEKIERILMSI